MSEIDRRSVIAQEQKEEVGNIIEQILAISLLGEQVFAWNKTDSLIYKEKHGEVFALLQKLQSQITEQKQHTRISNIITLLSSKETQTFDIKKDLDELRVSYKVLSEHIPDVIRKTQQDKQLLAKQIGDNYIKNGKKKEGIAGLFRNKKKIYEQTEKENAAIIQKSQARSDLFLNSLTNDIQQIKQTKHEQLLTHIDNLSSKNSILSQEISRLVSEFGHEEQLRMNEKLTAYLLDRKKALRQVSILGIGTMLLAIALYLILHFDLKKKIRYRLQLEESNRRNEELLHARKNMMLTISHDLRTPLTSIRGCTELLINEKLKKKRNHLCETILQSSDNMASLLNTLLSFYRLDTGKEESYPVPFRIKSLAEKLEAGFQPLADKAELTFKVEYGGDDVVVKGDKERLLQIAGNLLSNAIKFTTEGEVSLFIAYKRNMLTIKVSDTGTGMTQEQTERIFQPFERLGNAETREGFGLGLAITQGFIALLNGTIEVQSELGKGSTFLVHIPLSVLEEQFIEQKSNPTCHLPAGLKILVIDDDDLMLAMIRNMLSYHKIRCDTCRNIQELIVQMRRNEYDLLITDIRMPNVNGYDVLELLRTSDIGMSRTIPLLALTADTEYREDTFTSVGFTGCLNKPFSMSELLSAVESCVKKQSDKPDIKADFSKLLAQESDREGMLKLLIRDTDKNIEMLLEYVKQKDHDAIFLLAHRLLPLWEILNIESPLRELYDLLLSDTAIQDDIIQNSVNNILKTGESLVKQAEDQIEEVVYG